MNCERCQDLVGDFLDGSLSQQDQSILSAHLKECLSCDDVRNDLEAILGFCKAHRGEYEAPPNEKALWQGIRNVIESDASAAIAAAPAPARSSKSWLSRSWELSFPQLAAAVAAIVLVVSLSTIVGLRRYQVGAVANAGDSQRGVNLAGTHVRDRFSHQQQMISFWNSRVEYNKARWNPQMRETFDRNLQVIDQAVNVSLTNLDQNPHDEVSEQMLNQALDDKLALLKEFAEL